jgi:hypothetical protein
VASGSAPPAFAPESRRDWHQLESRKLEAQRAKCGPAVDDPELFAYQVVTGECRRDPLASTRRLGRVTVDRVEVRGEGRVVVITVSSLEDDSVRDERRRLELARAAGDAGGGWTITWAGAVYRCWPGRGHQDFTKDFCI